MSEGAEEMIPGSEDTGIVPRSELVQRNSELGDFETIEITAPTWQEAHKQLGERVGPRIREIARAQIADLTGNGEHQTAALTDAFAQIKSIRQATQEKVHGPSGEYVAAYLDSLGAWAGGAQLEEVAEHIRAQTGDASIDALDVALWLQNDNVGCQSLMRRQEDGTILMLHTEEDTSGHVDKPRLATISIGTDGDEQVTSFIYPTLLPGPAYGMHQKGTTSMFQGVDFLYNSASREAGSLANMLAWISLTTGKYDQIEELVKDLGPFVDGYALNTVERVAGRPPRAKRVVFAHDKQRTTELSREPGALLRQVNVYADEDRAFMVTTEEIDPEYRHVYERRLARQSRMVHLAQLLSGKELDIDMLERLAAFRVGGEYSMANKDVVSYALLEAREDGIRTILKPGSAISERSNKTA